MQIADEAEARYGRTLSWGASIGETREVFTQLAAPAMTRLRQDQRRVLDTLVDSGVARSRSEALAWCVQLVGQHADAWLGRAPDRNGRGRQAAQHRARPLSASVDGDRFGHQLGLVLLLDELVGGRAHRAARRAG